MITFIIIVSIVVMLAILINYFTKDAYSAEKTTPTLTPLNQAFKPIIPDIYNEDDESVPAPLPPPVEPSFPPNPSEAYIAAYYNSLSEEKARAKLGPQSMDTINMYVKSHQELNLSMFGKAPTIEMIHEAYEKLLNEQLKNIAMGVNPGFDISTKKRAKEYLIAHYTALNK